MFCRKHVGMQNNRMDVIGSDRVVQIRDQSHSRMLDEILIDTSVIQLY